MTQAQNATTLGAKVEGMLRLETKKLLEVGTSDGAKPDHGVGSDCHYFR